MMPASAPAIKPGERCGARTRVGGSASDPIVTDTLPEQRGVVLQMQLPYPVTLMENAGSE